MNKWCKIGIVAALSVALMGLAVGCTRQQNQANSSVYDEYVAYAQSQGQEPLSYENWIATVKGEKGDKGDKGERGEQGVPGERGPQGERGADGRNGTDGVDGLPGKDGRDGVDGLPGRDGRDGVDGTPGRDGVDGADGTDGRVGFVVYDYASLAAASHVDNAYIVLSGDIDLDGGVTFSGKDAVLDLNGHRLYNTQDIWDDNSGAWALVTVSGGILSIVGDGEMIAKDNDCFDVTVRDGAKCEIYSGKFVGNIHAVYVHDGDLQVFGGDYSVVQKFSAARPDDYVLNCLDASYREGKATITVYGGTFHGFNPADCYAEGANTDFVAEGYTVTSEQGDPIVYKVTASDVDEDTDGQ